jgi:Mg-chelatase subunit ChlD
VPTPGIGELRAHRPGEREAEERPLHLAHHKVQVRVVGNVARTEIEETFHNDGPHVLEGVYRFPLPPGARISSLALEVDGQWEEGAFVERDHARKIWRGVIRQATPQAQRKVKEEFVWVPGPWKDPALLEWQSGGRFELRIFPIPARGARRIRLAYTQTLSPHRDGRRYVYPLAHSADESTRVGRFEVDVRVAGASDVRPRGYEMRASRDGDAHRLHYAAEGFHPAGDLVIDYDEPGGSRELRHWTFRGAATAPPPTSSREVGAEVMSAHRGLHDDARPYVAFALRPRLPAWTEDRRRDYVIVVDTSQSMFGERHRRATRLVSALVSEMDRRDRFVVLACDLGCRAMESTPAHPSTAAAESVARWLEGIRPAGSSDLGAALREAAEVARRAEEGDGGRDAHVLYIGDGVPSAGHRRPSSLAAEVRALVERGSPTVGSVGIGADADATVLATLARAGGGHYVPFVPGQATGSTALAVLETTYGVTLHRPTIELPAGIADIAPAELPTLRAGEELIVVGRLERDAIEGEVHLRGTVGGREWSDRYPVSLVSTNAAGNAFVPRLWASQSIENLELEGRGENAPKIVALSKAFGVMSRHTSLLVLESEAMFRAFGVDRAQPTVQWTGEEETVSGESAGVVHSDDPVFGLQGSGAGAGGLGMGASGSPHKSSARARRSPAPRPELPSDMQEFSPGGAIAPEPPGRRSGQWMRRVRYRAATVRPGGDPRPTDRQAVNRAEEALREAPDSRDRHRDLVRALSRAAALDRTIEIAEQWLERDPLDPEALTYLSDALGRQGRRAEALRLLSGVVDVQPESEVLHRRLSGAYDRAGMPERACAHKVTLAELSLTKADPVSEALRCERALGRPEAAARILDLVTDARVRSQADHAASKGSSSRIAGELILDATWQAPVDVDLTIVTPQGTRLSWMGGRVHVVGQDASHRDRERLGLRRVTPGTYYLEVSRTGPSDQTVQGQVEIRALGERRVLPFTLTGDRVPVGQITVANRTRMEPVR